MDLSEDEEKNFLVDMGKNSSFFDAEKFFILVFQFCESL